MTERRFRRATTVDASLESVWEFHSRIAGLTRVTPDVLGLTVEAIRDADGTPLSGDAVLGEGTEIDLSLRPGGIVSVADWTSRIVERRRSADRAHFRDEMIAGPFRHWSHTHRFARADGGTRITDEVAVDAGPLTLPVTVALEAAFADRHRRTRRALSEAGSDR